MNCLSLGTSEIEFHYHQRTCVLDMQTIRNNKENMQIYTYTYMVFRDSYIVVLTCVCVCVCTHVPWVSGMRRWKGGKWPVLPVETRKGWSLKRRNLEEAPELLAK